MKSWKIAFVLAICGCGARDPFAGSHEPLAVGSEALTFYDKTYGVPGGDDPDAVRVTVLSARRKNNFDLDEIPVGIRVRVIEDAEAKGGKPDRPVKVLMLEGKYKGEPVLIARERLRPVVK
jgi:hypothetical protein